MAENFSEPKFEGGFRSELYAEGVARAERIRDDLLYSRNGAAFNGASVDKVEELRLKYPDYIEYRLYHVLSGSTPLEGQKFVAFDFPGDDSIIKFLEDKTEELNK